jgi:hypothetical protein
MLTPVVHEPHGAVVVVTRKLRETSVAICGWNGSHYTKATWLTDKPRAPCRRSAKTPVVLGLADRAFEKTLNDTLASDAMMLPPNNPEGIGVDVDFAVSLAARGILSVVFTGQFVCGAIADCTIDGYADGHDFGASSGLSVAVDAGVIAKSPAEYIDLARARDIIHPVLVAGQAHCAGPTRDDALTVDGAVLEETGVSIEHDECVNHVHSHVWTLVPYAKLASALKNGSPFEAAWR